MIGQALICLKSTNYKKDEEPLYMEENVGKHN